MGALTFPIKFPRKSVRYNLIAGTPLGQIAVSSVCVSRAMFQPKSVR